MNQFPNTRLEGFSRNNDGNVFLRTYTRCFYITIVFFRIAVNTRHVDGKISYLRHIMLTA